MKILICAYSCLKDPDERFGNGGESFLGWNMVHQISRFGDVYILTHFKNKNIIENKLLTEGLPNAKFYYIGLPLWVESLNKFHGGIQVAAYFWQIKSYFVAKKLHKVIKFDAFHHVTYANDWMASFIGALLPISYIRGPGGGAHKIPKAFLKDYTLSQKFLEKLRSIWQWIFRHDPFFIIGQNRAKVILVCNQESFNAIPKKWHNKTYFLPVNGISEKDLQVSVKKKNNNFTIITAGKLLKLKNFDLSIKAFKIFHSSFPKSELIIVGDGPEFSNLLLLTEKLAISQNVSFKKWMPREQLLSEIALSDIFLFPSLRDGGGAVVVEAMAQGKPVICFDIAGPGFHIDESCGIKINPKSPEQSIRDMAGAIEKLYADIELREKMGKKAKEKAEKFYLWDNLGNRLKEIYNKIIFDEK